MNSINSNYSTPPLQSSGILNVGNHEFLVSSVLDTSNAVNDDFDNYDTLDTFEACKLNVEFQQIAKLVSGQGVDRNVKFVVKNTENVITKASSVDFVDDMCKAKGKDFKKALTGPFKKLYKKRTSLETLSNLDHTIISPSSEIIINDSNEEEEINIDTRQNDKANIENSSILRDKTPTFPELYFSPCNYRYDHLSKKEDRMDFKKIEFNFDENQEPLVFRKVRKRLINKYGSTNVVQSNISNRKQHFLSDIYTTLLDTKWRWSILIFALGFILSWTMFALIWWLIAFSHGDFDHIGDPEWIPCFTHAHTFTAVLLFSIETQHTIGYGFRHITPECPEGIIVFMIQAITGAMIQGFVIGLIFNKLSRPKKRAATLMFSKSAVICTRDGVLCLLVRIGDMRKSHIIDARTRAYLYRKKVTLEGEVIPLHPQPMDLSFDSSGRNDRIFLGWPSILVHEIKDDAKGNPSPLYNLGARELAEEKFEIVVILEGMIEASGMSMQARTSYLPSEILWGHRFAKLLTYVREDGDYNVDYLRFNETVSVNMPSCSARDLDLLRKKYAEEKIKIKNNPKHMTSTNFQSNDVHEMSNNNNCIDATTTSLTMFRHVLNSLTTTLPAVMKKLDDLELRMDSLGGLLLQKHSTHK